MSRHWRPPELQGTGNSVALGLEDPTCFMIQLSSNLWQWIQLFQSHAMQPWDRKFNDLRNRLMESKTVFLGLARTLNVSRALCSMVGTSLARRGYESTLQSLFSGFNVDSDYLGRLTERSGGFHWGKDRFLWSFPREAREASSSWYSWTPTTWPADTDVQTCSSMLPVHWRRNLIWLQISY